MVIPTPRDAACTRLSTPAHRHCSTRPRRCRPRRPDQTPCHSDQPQLPRSPEGLCRGCSRWHS